MNEDELEAGNILNVQHPSMDFWELSFVLQMMLACRSEKYFVLAGRNARFVDEFCDAELVFEAKTNEGAVHGHLADSGISIRNESVNLNLHVTLLNCMSQQELHLALTQQARSVSSFASFISGQVGAGDDSVGVRRAVPGNAIDLDEDPRKGIEPALQRFDACDDLRVT